MRNEVNGAPKSAMDVEGSHEGTAVVASLEAKVANLEEKLAEANVNGDADGTVNGKAEAGLNGHAPP